MVPVAAVRKTHSQSVGWQIDRGCFYRRGLKHVAHHTCFVRLMRYLLTGGAEKAHPTRTVPWRPLGGPVD
jgi:hypothetical protein